MQSENKVKTHCHTLMVIQVQSESGNRTRSRLNVIYSHKCSQSCLQQDTEQGLDSLSYSQRIWSTLTVIQSENKVKTHCHTVREQGQDLPSYTYGHTSAVTAACSKKQNTVQTHRHAHTTHAWKTTSAWKRCQSCFSLQQEAWQGPVSSPPTCNQSGQVMVHGGCCPTHQPHQTVEESSGASQRPSPLIKDQTIPKTSSAIFLCTWTPRQWPPFFREHLLLTYLSLCQAFVFTLLSQNWKPNSLFCILICHFLSSQSTRPSPVMPVFVVWCVWQNERILISL